VAVAAFAVIHVLVAVVALNVALACLKFAIFANRGGGHFGSFAVASLTPCYRCFTQYRNLKLKLS
jgi:hypothetical protein